MKSDNRNKILVLILIIILTPILAGIYGIAHDLFTYNISTEYYTKLKFYQFGMIDNEMNISIPKITAVIIIGFRATWWVGIIIGVVL